MAQRNAQHMIQAGAKYREGNGEGTFMKNLKPFWSSTEKSMSWNYRLASWLALLPEDIQDLQGGALDSNPNSTVIMLSYH